MKELKQIELDLHDWAEARNLLRPEVIDRQFMKMVEEVGECAQCIGKGHTDTLRLEIGDVFVTLAILAFQHDMSLAECANAAYDKIKDRTGKLINNTFVKDDDL